MCTDIDDAESQYGKISCWPIRDKPLCKECNGQGHKGRKKNSLFFIQCKKCNGTGRLKNGNK